MYELILTEIRYPKNLTSIYEYQDYLHLSKGLEYLLENDLINKNTIIRIEKKEV